MWKKFKKQRAPKAGTGWLRKQHRRIGIMLSLLMFTFSGSGAFHLLAGEADVDPDTYRHIQHLDAGMLSWPTKELFRQFPALTNISVAQAGNRCYYRVSADESGRGGSATHYIHAATGQEWRGGDQAYATYLAESLLGKEGHSRTARLPASVAPVMGFSGEYGFINKRLPVVKVAYQGDAPVSYFIETATGILALKAKPINVVESYTFASLHKFYLVSLLFGMQVQDGLLVLAALGILWVSLLGLLIFMRR